VTPRSQQLHSADPGCREQGRAWIFHELAYVRREAQAEADLAYEAWGRSAGRDRYAVYRAAQDRADAAQDELATWVWSNPHDL
jgi:acyl-CoA reductase-like NAD-dependent aldehyde dehydrogenase